jgi:hypothetical protein
VPSPCPITVTAGCDLNGAPAAQSPKPKRVLLILLDMRGFMGRSHSAHPPPSRSSLAALCWLTPARLSVQSTGRNVTLRVSPIDRLAFAHHHALAIEHFTYGRYEETANAAPRAVQSNPGFSVARCLLAAALAKLGRTEDAKAAAVRVLVVECQHLAQMRSADMRRQCLLPGESRT